MFRVPRFSKRKSTKNKPLVEVNVVPLVDVMLVLLIIFMISAPLMQSGIVVNLPSSKAPPLERVQKPIIITLTKEDQCYIGNETVPEADLSEKLNQIVEGDRGRTLYIRADAGLTYGAVVKLMGQLNQAGYTQLALISQVK
jgi:biopolymer transport protein ExbD